jgi:hypothetical protein
MPPVFAAPPTTIAPPVAALPPVDRVPPLDFAPPEPDVAPPVSPASPPMRSLLVVVKWPEHATEAEKASATGHRNGPWKRPKDAKTLDARDVNIPVRHVTSVRNGRS